MTPLWLSETVAEYWDLAGGEEPFPRSLERSVSLALPLAIVKMPRLRIRSIEEWLDRRGIVCGIAFGDRLLRGCLVAHRGCGLIFIDGADTPDELRFTLAHEVAHFIVDYHQVRERASRLLGPRVLEVLDGMRPPTADERVHAILGSAPLGLRLHLMQRSAFGYGEGSVDEAERRANRLAVELLAPLEEVRRRLHRVSDRASAEEAMGILVADMGLPPAVARWYARIVVSGRLRQSTFLRQLGLRR